MKKDIEQSIQQRIYQSPGRARSAVARCRLNAKKKAQMYELINAWENEADEPPLVGGLPSTSSKAPVADLVPARPHRSPVRLLRPSLHHPTLPVSLGVRVRATLTPYGITLLYAERMHVTMPEDLLERGGVWETELWRFMQVMGPHLAEGSAEVPTVGNLFEIIDPDVIDTRSSAP